VASENESESDSAAQTWQQLAISGAGRIRNFFPQIQFSNSRKLHSGNFRKFQDPDSSAAPDSGNKA
jgi:hypothetical protein